MAGQAGISGVTLQTLPSFQGAVPGRPILLKKENGEMQWVMLGSVPQNNMPAGTVTQNSSVRSAGVSTPGAVGTSTSIRLASLSAAVAPTVTTSMATPAVSTIAAATTTSAANTQATPSVGPLKRQATDGSKEKCRRFLVNLLELSDKEPEQVKQDLRALIQELINDRVEPEVFCVRLEKLLNSTPQPCLIGFLKKSLPFLRQSLVAKELVIEGIRPPPANVVFSIATVVSTLTQNQIRPTVAVSRAATATHVIASRAVGTPTAIPQVRVMAPKSNDTNVPRSPQLFVQQKVVQQIKMVRPPMKTYVLKAPTTSAITMQQQQQQPPMHTSTSAIRQTTGQVIVQKTTSMNTVVKTLQPAQNNKFAIKSSTMMPAQLNKFANTSSTLAPAQQKKLANASSTLAPVQQNKLANASGTLNKTIVPSTQQKPTFKEKEKETFSSAGYAGDDDINDVAAMGGVNLAEESQSILGSSTLVGTQIRSCKDKMLLHTSALQNKINKRLTSYGLEEPNQEVSALISHAVEERLKTLIEKLSVIAEHRMESVKTDPRYKVTQDVKAQLRFLQELDKVERKRHEEEEREILLKAAKSRSKTEDPEQAEMKAKAREMQRVEMEQARKREADETALQAIGIRKKPKLDIGDSTTNTLGANGRFKASAGSGRLPIRPRLKLVNLRDLLFLLEQEKESRRSTTLYRSYLK